MRDAAPLTALAAAPVPAAADPAFPRAADPARTRGALRLGAALLVAPAVAIALLWLPFGFRLGALIEEWQVLSLFAAHGLFFVADRDSLMAVHALRPLTIFPHALAYLLDPGSFDYWHVLTMLSLLAKGAATGFLAWRILRSEAWALAAGVLVILHPADTMQVPFRSLHINVSLALLLVSACLLVAAHDHPRRRAGALLAACAGALLLAAALMYEAALPLLLLPLAVLWAADGLRATLPRLRERPEVPLLWLGAAAAWALYAWSIATTGETYQGHVAGPDIGATLARTWHQLFTVGALRALAGGWHDAAAILRVEYARYGYLLAGTLLCCATAWGAARLARPRAAATGRPPARRILGLAACGLVLLLLGYILFLPSPAHLASTQRTYLFATPGAVLVTLAGLIALARVATALAAAAFAALVLLGLAAQLLYFQQYALISERQREVLRAIVEAQPAGTGGRTLLVLDGSNRLNHTWMLRDSLRHALTYLQGRPVTRVEICLWPSGAWQALDGFGRPGQCEQTASGWRLRPAAPVGGPGVAPYERGPDLELPAAGTLVARIGDEGLSAGAGARLAAGDEPVARRYRGFLVAPPATGLLRQFTAVRETARYRTDLGRWWNIDQPPEGSGWRDADWSVGHFHHDAGAWTVMPTATLSFLLAPRGGPGVLRGRFDALAGGREGFALRVNGQPVEARWLDDYHFQADVPAGALADGRNVLEFRARTAPDYYGLGAKLTWLEVDAR